MPLCEVWTPTTPRTPAMERVDLDPRVMALVGEGVVETTPVDLIVTIVGETATKADALDPGEGPEARRARRRA